MKNVVYLIDMIQQPKSLFHMITKEVLNLNEKGINIKTKYIVGNKILERNSNNSHNDDITSGIICKKEYYTINPSTSSSVSSFPQRHIPGNKARFYDKTLSIYPNNSILKSFVNHLQYIHLHHYGFLCDN